MASFTSVQGRGRPIESLRRPVRLPLLQADPELGLRVPAGRIAEARANLVVRVEELEPGIWEVPGDCRERGNLGMLMLSGVLARDVLLAGVVCTELLGEGDFLQPWVGERDDGLLHYHVYWHVVTPVRIALLDAQFGRRVVEWPQVTAALLERAVRRTMRMSIHQALLQLSPVETRLLVLFWYLAERWGRVVPGGVVLPLRLSHELLGQLVGCRRASVTTALKAVAASGQAERRDDGAWLLQGPAPDEFHRFRWQRDGHDPGAAQTPGPHAAAHVATA